MSDERMHRVTVRGRFAGLTPATRARLAREQPQHDVFVSAYTPEGTFTYDARIHAFNVRFELQAEAGASAKDIGAVGIAKASALLAAEGVTHSELSVDVVDVSAIHDDVARRRALR